MIKTHSATLLVLTLIACAQAGGNIPSTQVPVNSLGMKMVRIEGGTFQMGGRRNETPLPSDQWDECPLHKVTISRPFHISATEVTNAQYEQFDPEHRKYRGLREVSTRDDEAVTYVSWNEAAAGNEQVGSGLFDALSTDEGKSWQIKRLITDGGPPRTVDGGGNTGKFIMSATSAEPRGYPSICRAADGVIHLISSKQHYAFNLAWLNTLPPAPPEPPKLEAKARLLSAYRPVGRPSQDGWRYNGTGVDEADAVEVLADGGIGIKTGPGQRARWVGDSKKTFHAADGAAHTTEIVMRVTRSTSPRRGIDFETYVPGVGRAMISVTTSDVLWHGGRAEPIAQELDNAGALHTYQPDEQKDVK